MSEIYRRSPNVFFKQLSEKKIALLHRNDLDHYYQIDRYAADLWLLLDGKRTLQQISEALAKKSKLDSGLVTKKTKAMVSQLQKNRLVELLKN